MLGGKLTNDADGCVRYDSRNEPEATGRPVEQSNPSNGVDTRVGLMFGRLGNGDTATPAPK